MMLVRGLLVESFHNPSGRWSRRWRPGTIFWSTRSEAPHRC